MTILILHSKQSKDTNNIFNSYSKAIDYEKLFTLEIAYYVIFDMNMSKMYELLATIQINANILLSYQRHCCHLICEYNIHTMHPNTPPPKALPT